MHINPFLQSDSISILTSTERLVRELRGRRVALKRASGERQWDDPVFIGTLRRYCSIQWDSLFDGRQLLHPEQFLTLCKQTIDSSGSSDGVISSMAMARKMRQAERLIREFEIDVTREGHLFGPELSAFYHWHRSLTDRLKRSDYITEYDLPSLLVQSLNDGCWSPQNPIVLYGFVQLTPVEVKFIDALRERGVEVHVLEAQPAHSKALSHVAHSPEDEFCDAAHWLRHQISSVPGGQKPPRCALIVPELDRCRVLVRHVLDRELAPNALRAGVTPLDVENVPWYAFAGGEYLAELPWIRSVMDLLALKTDGNSIDDLSRMLLGFASPIEQNLNFEAAKLDLKLRAGHGWKVSGKAFVNLLTSSNHICFRRLGKNTARYLDKAGSMALPSGWADRFEEFIREAGFLDSDRLMRSELQQWQSFQDALDVLRSLDAQMGQLPFEPVYRWLDEICHTRRYSNEQSAQAPVQVLAPEEAFGLTFDRAWVVAVDSRNFPGAVEPNPFLPINAQIDAGVPNSSSGHSSERSQRLLDHISQCARGIVLSIHNQSGGAPCIPSGLVEWTEMPALRMESFKGNSDRNTIKLASTRKPDRFPEVTAKEKETLKSGVSILADFAQDELCAAIVHRLHVKSFPEIEAGLTAAIQGNLMHDALNLFWSKVRTSQNLHLMTGSELKERAHAVVRQAMEDSSEISVDRYGANMLALERYRLADLVLSWLEFEKTRVQPFEVVVCEGVTESEIQGFRFKVRIDRIDRVLGNSGKEHFLVIDYKTGRIVDMRALNSDRLKSPQLPIYATFTDLARFGIDRVDGVALAKVYSGELSLHLRSNWTTDLHSDASEGGLYDSFAQQWRGQLEAWKNRLTDNAEGFLFGDSRLRYRPHEYLGAHAHLQPLMRLGDG